MISGRLLERVVVRRSVLVSPPFNRGRRSGAAPSLVKRPVFGDQQMRFGRGQLEYVADVVIANVDSVEIVGEFPSKPDLQPSILKATNMPR